MSCNSLSDLAYHFSTYFGTTAVRNVLTTVNFAGVLEWLLNAHNRTINFHQVMNGNLSCFLDKTWDGNFRGDICGRLFIV